MNDNEKMSDDPLSGVRELCHAVEDWVPPLEGTPYADDRNFTLGMSMLMGGLYFLQREHCEHKIAEMMRDIQRDFLPELVKYERRGGGNAG